MKSRHIILLLISVLFSVRAFAADTDIQKADQAYTNENYTEALSYYLKVLKDDGSSSDLYYNIANTYYRLGEPGNAVLYYKRALKTNPANSEARQNLEFVQSQLVDQIDNRPSWSERTTERVYTFFSPNGWAVASLIAFAILLVCVAGYFLGDTISIKKISFFSGIVLLAFTIVSMIIGFRVAARTQANTQAVIITPSVQLSTVPRQPQNPSEQAFSLHEGTVVEILDSVKVSNDTINPKWFEVKVNNEHRAWIPATDVERI